MTKRLLQYKARRVGKWESGKARSPLSNFLTFSLSIFAAFSFVCAAIALDGPFTPEESLKHFQTEPGLRVELVAAEPMVVDPVAIAWDERGRMFVVEDRGYPTGPGNGHPPVGQIVLLEDANGDGQFDQRTVFADGLTFPNGVMPWNGGVYVTCAPNLYYFKDTDGDGKADVKKIVFKGFQDLSTTQLRVSHPTLAIDNWVYLTSGLTAAKVTSPQNPNRPEVFLNRVDGRFRPGTDQIEPTAGAAQFGQTFDAFGRRFICSNRNHIQHVVMQSRDLERNPRLHFTQVVEDIPDHGAACRLYPLSANIVTAASHGGYVTSACGVTIYNGTALPDSYRGNSFTCEPAGNLVHRDVLEPKGVTFVARRAFPTNEFLASPDNWFRPVNLAVGPDGALYVCDMYRKTIEHPQYLPEATRAVTDFESGKGMGRLYRVVTQTPGRKNQTPKKFDLTKLPAKDLVAELENPNVWWRMTAQRLLLERRDKSVTPHLTKLAKQGRSPDARIQALRTLDGIGGLPDELIASAFKDRDAGVRENAIQLAEPRLGNRRLAAQMLALNGDSNPRVRFQLAVSSGDFDDPLILLPLLKIVERDMDDPWIRAAVLSSIAGREYEFLRQLLAPVTLAARRDRSGKPGSSPQAAVARNHPDSFPMFMADVVRSLPPMESVPGELFDSANPADLPWQMAAITGLGRDLRARTAASPVEIRSRVQTLLERAGEFALDAKQTSGARLAAINLLGLTDYATAGPALEKLIEPRQPAEIQTAAIRALGQIAGTEAGAAMVKRERWNAYTPAVRDAVLTVLTGSTNFLPALFAAIEAGDVPPWTVNADRRAQLMKHKDADLRQRAEKLFKDLKSDDRMKVYEQSKPALRLTGNGNNGRALFQKNCASCHTFSGEGHLVGPDLTGIRNQPAEAILLHIIVPEQEIMPIYTSYNVETKAGENFTGLLAAETPGSITLRMAQGIEQTVQRKDIASMTTSRFSLMPQDLEKGMTQPELADLLAFLKGQ